MTDCHPSLDVTHWHPIHEVDLTAQQHSWLGECQSMTARFERYCDKVTIVPRREGFQTVSAFGYAKFCCVVIMCRGCLGVR